MSNRRGNPKIVRTVVPILFIAVGQAGAHIVFSNLGPGDSYQTGCGWTVGGSDHQAVGGRMDCLSDSDLFGRIPNQSRTRSSSRCGVAGGLGSEPRRLAVKA